MAAERFVHIPQQRSCTFFHRGDLAVSDQRNDKFIAAKPRDKGVGEIGTQDIGGDDKRFVAGLMAVRIVDLLKIIKVYVYKTEGLLPAVLIHIFVEIAPVVQSGKEIRV